MTVVCVGTSHWSAPIESMERALAMARSVASSYESAIQDGCTQLYPWSELVLLATCNRVELYVVADANGDEALEWIQSTLTPHRAAPDVTLYTHRGDDAVRHLARVAAGLDSMVLGEPEIAGQVSRAFAHVMCRNGGPASLERVARFALQVSRRARAETGISRGPASLSTLAIHMAATRLGGLGGKQVLVVGAGKTGRVACAALRSAGDAHTHITIVNRTLSRAENVARRINAHAAPLDTLADHLTSADLVISSTSAPRHLLEGHDVRRAMAERSDRPLVLVDLAVPRDVDPACAFIDDVHLIGIEDLRQNRDTQLDARRQHVPAVEAILESALREWKHDLETEPVIAELYRHAESARRCALVRAWPDIDRLDDETRARIDYVTRALVRRILREPATRLRNETHTGRRRDLMQALRSLFDLDSESRLHEPDRS